MRQWQTAADDSGTARRTRLLTRTFLGFGLAVLLAFNAVACSSGGSGETADDTNAAVGDEAAGDANGADDTADGDGAESGTENLPPGAVGSAAVTGNGDVVVVQGTPPKWNQAYTGSDAPAAAASTGSSMVAYLLDDGSVHTVAPDGGDGVDIWNATDGQSPATAIDMTGKRVAIVTSDGSVHVSGATKDAVSDSVVWTADNGAATDVAAVKSGIFVLAEGGAVSFVPNQDGEPQKLPVEGAIAIDGRGTRVAALKEDGEIVTVNVAETGSDAVVVWDGSGAESKVTDIVLGANLVMLFEDGTVRSKPAGATDPNTARMVWNQVEKWGPATAIGAHDELVMFELKNGRARWFDRTAPEGQRNGVYSRGSGADAIALFAS